MTPEQITKGQQLAREFKPLSGQNAPGPKGAAASKAPENATVTANTAKGVLNVRAADDSYEVFVDGSFVGNTPARLKLDSGSHDVEVKKAGYKDFRKTIKITDGSELNLRAALERQ